MTHAMFQTPLAPAARQLARAAIAVVAEQGFDQLSVRRVAAQAQVAPGTVQHYFPTRTALLTAAFQQTVDDIAERVAWPSSAGSTVATLTSLLAHALPLDEHRRRECVVWVALTAAAAVQPDLAVIHRNAVTAFVGLLTGVLVESAMPTEQAAEVARALVVAVDGLTMHGITGTLVASELTDRLTWFVRRLVPG